MRTYPFYVYLCNLVENIIIYKLVKKRDRKIIIHYNLIVRGTWRNG